MPSPKRLLMKASLANMSTEKVIEIRKIQSEDIIELGDVMFEAYFGTIDYNGESIEEARIEVNETLNGKYGTVIEDACLLIEKNGIIASAVIFNWFEKESLPLLTFSMTRATFKGMGFAKKLLKAGLSTLAEAGYSSCCLVVTEGNEPAVSIYKSLGFKVTNED